MTETLALEGGVPVRRTGTWRKWPFIGDSHKAYVAEVLEGPRLSTRSHWEPGLLFDDRLAEAVTKFYGSAYAVPVSTGTTAIEIALEAMGIGANDEVIMPALTWVAAAIAALRINATPVFVDVDPQSYTLDPAAVEAAITPHTAAIIPVHWHCTITAMDAIMNIAQRYGLKVVEDCAQAHSGRYKGRMVGTWGDAGAFSFHNDKLLSSGEGGIIITDAEKYFIDAHALRSDGFDWAPSPVPFVDGPYAQSGFGRIMGTSSILPETSCALALAGIELLAQQTLHREQNGELLYGLFGKIPGFSPIIRQEGVDIRPFYEFSVRIDRDYFQDVSIMTVCKAVAAELGFPVYPETEAMSENVLYQPKTRRRYAASLAHLRDLESFRFHAPVAQRACQEVLMFLHPPLLGTRQDIEDIATAFAKISYHSDRLRSMEQTGHKSLSRVLSYWS